MNASDLESLTDLLADCYDDPDLFNTAILDRPDCWSSADSPEPQYPGQVEWCKALVEYHTLCIETGNMLGKDWWIGLIVPWWLWTRPNSLVIVMGPGQTTLGTITWKEIRRAIEGCPFWPSPLAARVSVGAKSSPAVVEVCPGYQALGYSTTNVERASGQHAAELLVIVEEASGVEDHAWEAIDSLGATKLVAIGNPLRAQCGFARLCDRAQADERDGIPPRLAVKHFNVPSTACPDAQLEVSPRGMASKVWLEGMIRKWGAKSAWAMSHIFAKRPRVGGQYLVPEGWLNYHYAQTRPTVAANHPIHLTRRISCDLGEGVGRDSSCVLVRDDWGVLDVVHGNQLGVEAAAGVIAELAKKWKVPHNKISYDKLGIGKTMPNHLAKWGITTAIGYAGSGAPLDRNAFSNVRTEAGWKCHLRLDVEHIPDAAKPWTQQQPFYFAPGTYQEQLRDQLKPLTYQCKGTGIELMRKDEWCEILGCSPDIADAMLQSFAFS